MKEKMKENNGFTLVELIIAIAILAFLMTAVSSLMTSGLITFKKAKGDITVHNSAQETYNLLVDTIMQSKDVVVCAYVARTPGQSVEFGKSGEETSVTLDGPYYYVRDEKQKDSFESTIEYTSDPHDVKYFSSLSTTTKLYVVSIIADVAEPIEIGFCSPNTVGTHTNNITNESNIDIQIQTREKEDGSTEEVVSSINQVVYNINDTCRNIISFDDQNMYYQRRYAFMTGLDDCLVNATGTDATMANYVYSKSFNYQKRQGVPAGTNDSVTGCIMTIDANNGSFSLELKFSDKNMTYTSQGMVKVRNSYVLKPKK